MEPYWVPNPKDQILDQLKLMRTERPDKAHDSGLCGKIWKENHHTMRLVMVENGAGNEYVQCRKTKVCR